MLEGYLPETAADIERLSAAERAEGWRLACQARVSGDIALEVTPSSGLILADDTPFSFEPGRGYGVAVDLGTTTVVAQLLDLSSARIVATQAALNPQARFGADVMSRINMALDPAGAEKLRTAVRKKVAEMVGHLAKSLPEDASITRATMVGNTPMHHLFIGHDIKPLAWYPFETGHLEGMWWKGAEIGWAGRAQDAEVFFLPNLGGFVGSDIAGVILATRMCESAEVTGAADLGTNGEIAFCNSEFVCVASTAAGPAFEGARIKQGMRAASGAIDRVSLNEGSLSVHVIGGVKPRGICGSGLVDAVACGLEMGEIDVSGRMKSDRFVLREPVALVKSDVRELQLAKGAIAAGIKIIMAEMGIAADKLARFNLAGAFGNSLDVINSGKIGLIPFPPEQVRPVGNAALLGAKMVLFMPSQGEERLKAIKSRVRHFSLERSVDFQDSFAENMLFGEE